MMSRSNNRDFLCDAHIDTLSKMLKFGRSDLKEIPKDSHVTLPKLRRSGLGLAVFACFTEKHDRSFPPLHRTLKMIDLAYNAANKYADRMEIVADYAGFLRAHRAGKLAIVLSIENGIAVEEDIAFLRMFHRMGVRLMGLTWNHRNRLGDGVGRPESRRGLSDLGRAVLAEMQRLGILIDVSHLNERTFWDVVEATRAPLVATHSNAFSICPHPRNLTDDQIKAIAQRKGFIGLNFCGLFLRQSGRASVHDVIEHAAYINEIGGEGVAAIGSDYDGITDPPVSLEHIGKLPALIRELHKAGFSRTMIQKLTHRNFLRVFRSVCG